MAFPRCWSAYVSYIRSVEQKWNVLRSLALSRNCNCAKYHAPPLLPYETRRVHKHCAWFVPLNRCPLQIWRLQVGERQKGRGGAAEGAKPNTVRPRQPGHTVIVTATAQLSPLLLPLSLFSFLAASLSLRHISIPPIERKTRGVSQVRLMPATASILVCAGCLSRHLICCPLTSSLHSCQTPQTTSPTRPHNTQRSRGNIKTRGLADDEQIRVKLKHNTQTPPIYAASSVHQFCSSPLLEISTSRRMEQLKSLYVPIYDICGPAVARSMLRGYQQRRNKEKIKRREEKGNNKHDADPRLMPAYDNPQTEKRRIKSNPNPMADSK